ncbi:MAG: polyisoprenoid-binding protein [Deltaproteobacteria bacterium]|nr:MAG: polyisoprenoid-binding protein [Deltaproteobacteria bacterium]
MKIRTILVPALTGLFLGLVAPHAARAEVEEWKIEPNHSAAHFAVKHLLISTVRGSFSHVTGTVWLDTEDITKSRVEAEIDATTIDTGNEKRDRHLKSGDFFNVKKCPKILFKSKKVEKDGDELKVVGDLTMNCVTKEVTLNVESISQTVVNPVGVPTRAIEATTKLNRQDFGISWNKSLDGGGVVVGDEVKVILDIQIIKPRAKK